MTSTKKFSSEQVISESFSLFTQNYLEVLMFSFLLFLTGLLTKVMLLFPAYYGNLIQNMNTSVSTQSALYVFFLVFSLIAFIAAIIFTVYIDLKISCALTLTISHIYDDLDSDYKMIFSTLRGKLLSYFGLSLLMGLPFIIIFTLVPLYLIFNIPPFIAGGLFVVFLIGYIYFLLIYALAPSISIIVDEKSSSLQYSKTITKGNRGRIFLIFGFSIIALLIPFSMINFLMSHIIPSKDLLASHDFWVSTSTSFLCMFISPIGAVINIVMIKNLIECAPKPFVQNKEMFNSPELVR